MVIVSISEAARLTGKARSTIQTYIKTGKLSKISGTTGKGGLDISELIRVFGEIKNTDNTRIENVVISHETTSNTTDAIHSQNKITTLELENSHLKAMLEAKQETINSLNRALLLLENKKVEPNMPISEQIKKPWWKLFS